MIANMFEQSVSFDRVLPWGKQVQALVQDEKGEYYLQVLAKDAKKVSFTMLEVEYPCTKNEEGIWSVRYPFTTGINFVQFKIDDVEVLTPLLPIGYGYSRPYNYVSLTVEGEDFYSIKDVPHGSVRREYFPSKVTGEWESIVVYTPYTYAENPNQEFPVLYLQHGHGENETGWTTAGKVQFIMDNLIAEKKAVPFLIVMSNGMVQTQNERGERIVDFRLLEPQLLEEIIPFVESRFRVKRDKQNRAMAGLSMGSLQTSMIGFGHPELFSYLGVFSGFLTDIITGSLLDQVKRGAGDNHHLSILEDRERFQKEFTLLFRAMGTEDPFFDTFTADDNLCREKGVEHVRKLYNGSHDWNVWRQCIRDFAQLLFQEES